ncbi:MAG: hypothetical protein ACMXYC_03305 [Candidatus Woesearchaeota archaeon]
MNHTQKVIIGLGYKNTGDFVIKYILPLFSVVLFMYFILAFLFTMLPFYIPYVVLFFGCCIIIGYPYIHYEQQKINIEENLHLFITYAGTISTIDISRGHLFKSVSKKKTLGQIATTFKKINYFAKRWNMGYSASCRKIGSLTPSKIFGDFLDRFAVMLDYGESLDVFLVEEQDALMDDFSANYKKSLESIKTIQDIFLSMTMALGFLISIGLILPLIADTSITSVLGWILLIFFTIDFMILVFVKNFIPADRLMQHSDIVDDGMKKIFKATFIAIPSSAVILTTLFLINALPFMINVAIGIIPLFYIGFIANQVENDVYNRDKAFPAFIRSLGIAIDIKSGAVMSAITSLRVHDFGLIDPMLQNLYKRLRTGNDKMLSWKYFAAECGSNLIYEFTQIFSESVSLGGRAEKIAEIISNNFQRILSLRKLKIQLASSLRGAMYGALVGFAGAAYVAAEISQLLSGLFSAPFSDASDTGEFAASLLGEINPSAALAVNPETIALYLGVMVIFHAIVSSIIIKVIDGGTTYAMFFDMSIMIWMGTVLSIMLPFVLSILLPGLGDLTGPM